MLDVGIYTKNYKGKGTDLKYKKDTRAFGFLAR